MWNCDIAITRERIAELRACLFEDQSKRACKRGQNNDMSSIYHLVRTKLDKKLKSGISFCS